MNHVIVLSFYISDNVHLNSQAVEFIHEGTTRTQEGGKERTTQPKSQEGTGSEDEKQVQKC